MIMMLLLIFQVIVLRLNLKGSTGDDRTKAVKVMVPLKYLSNFWKTFEMSLINCEINLILTWSASCVQSNAAENQATAFAITDTKLYVPLAMSSFQDNAKLLQQLKSGFKNIINWNKYQSKVT